MVKVKGPIGFYGANVRGADRAPRAGDDRPSASDRHLESTMNVPGARQVPVEGAVTGPDAPAAEVDEVYGQIELEDEGQQ